MGALTVLHILVCLILIGLVLIQDSKGGAGGMWGGGGSSSLLGPTGAPNFLAKLTRYTAIVFALLCIFLSKESAKSLRSALDTAAPAATEQSAPVAPAPAPDASAPANQPAPEKQPSNP